MSSGFCAGQMKLTSVVPGRISAISPARRRAHLEDDVGAAHELGGAAGDLRAGRPVGVIGEIRAVAGACLDADGEAQLDQLLDDLGHRGDTFLAREISRGTPIVSDMVTSSMLRTIERRASRRTRQWK